MSVTEKTLEPVAAVVAGPDAAAVAPAWSAPRSLLRRHGWLALALGVATCLSLLILVVGPPGVDRAAHLYQTRQFAEHGWRVWDNYWYAGRYEVVNYSLLYYPLAALLGELVVVVGSILGGVLAFGLLVRRTADTAAARWATLAFAVTWPMLLVAGQYPFALGTTLGLLALLLAARRQPLRALAAAAGALLASPLAYVLLVIALAGLAAADPGVLRRPRVRLLAVGLLGLVLAEVVILRLFPSGGRFPYPPLDLLGIVLLAVAGVLLARGDRSARPVAGIVVMYGLAGIVAFVVPGAIGGNIARLLDYFALPVLLLLLVPAGFRPRVLAVAALLVAGLWQAIPVVRDLRGGLETRANSTAFWAEAVTFLHEHHDPDYRVEVVATWGHWESYHLASQGIPITRGWFRQDDFPVNEPLYTGDLDAARYRDWLRSMGVRYVVVPDETYDYSARREAELVNGPGRAGLTLRHDGRYVDILELPDATPILTSPAPVTPHVPGQEPVVVSMTPTAVALWLPADGVYDLRVRWTPYWRATGGDVCLARDGDSGMTRLYAHAAGLVQLRFDVTLDGTARQALGAAGPTCTFPPIGRDRERSARP